MRYIWCQRSMYCKTDVFLFIRMSWKRSVVQLPFVLLLSSLIFWTPRQREGTSIYRWCYPLPRSSKGVLTGKNQRTLGGVCFIWNELRMKWSFTRIAHKDLWFAIKWQDVYYESKHFSTDSIERPKNDHFISCPNHSSGSNTTLVYFGTGNGSSFSFPFLLEEWRLNSDITRSVAFHCAQNTSCLIGRANSWYN